MMYLTDVVMVIGAVSLLWAVFEVASALYSRRARARRRRNIRRWARTPERGGRDV